MKLKRILKAMKRKYGKASEFISRPGGSGTITFYVHKFGWDQYDFRNEAELRAHLGIIAKRDKCRKRIIE
jgi:hypothetical protein